MTQYHLARYLQESTWLLVNIFLTFIELISRQTISVQRREVTTTKFIDCETLTSEKLAEHVASDSHFQKQGWHAADMGVEITSEFANVFETPIVYSVLRRFLYFKINKIGKSHTLRRKNRRNIRLEEKKNETKSRVENLKEDYRYNQETKGKF